MDVASACENAITEETAAPSSLPIVSGKRGAWIFLISHELPDSVILTGRSISFSYSGSYRWDTVQTNY